MLTTVFLKVPVALCTLFLCAPVGLSLYIHQHQLEDLPELMISGAHEEYVSSLAISKIQQGMQGTCPLRFKTS